MLQQTIIYILLALATTYVGYRIYSSIKKKSACDKCGLMDAAKKAQKN
jgi:F0F1-type ATP synthase gamma subunit